MKSGSKYGPVKMQRRGFLGLSFLSAGAVAFFPKTATGISSARLNAPYLPYRAFMSESGILGKDDFFVLGMLYMPNSLPSVHSDALAGIKNANNYRSCLTYRSNDMYKIPAAQAFIDYFSADPDMKLLAKIVTKESLPPALNREQMVEMRFDLYNLFMYFWNVSSYSEGIVVKSQSPFGPSQYFYNKFMTETNMQINARDARLDPLLQLADLITGCIQGANSGNITNQTKLELLDYLKQSLGVAGLDAANLSQPGKIQLIT